MRAQTLGGRPHEHKASDAATLARELASDIAERLRAALAERGQASLVLSGGRTPAAMFRALREHALAWERVTITLADERWVDVDSADSNERMVRQELLQGPAAQARFVGLKSPAATPEQGCADLEAAVQRIARPFDVIVLGMGNDGHTASLFPDAPELGNALVQPELCTAMRPASMPQARLSLTLGALLDSRLILLHLVGEDKWQVYERALAGTDVTKMPVRAVLQQDRVPVQVYWSP